jgi:hypothetical protein
VKRKHSSVAAAARLLFVSIGVAVLTPALASDCYAINDPDHRSRCLAETR